MAFRLLRHKDQHRGRGGEGAQRGGALCRDQAHPGGGQGAGSRPRAPRRQPPRRRSGPAKARCRGPDLRQAHLPGANPHVGAERGYVQGLRGGRGLRPQPQGTAQGQGLGGELLYDGSHGLRLREPVYGGGQGPANPGRHTGPQPQETQARQLYPGLRQGDGEPLRQRAGAAALLHPGGPPACPAGHRPGETGGAASAYQDVRHGRPDGHRGGHCPGRQMGTPGHCHYGPRRHPFLYRRPGQLQN